MWKTLIFFLVLSFGSVSAWAKSPVAGDSAPDFNVLSMEGDRVSLSSFKGKVVLVGMFHICVPCKNQAIEFEKVRKALSSDKLIILGINTAGDSKEAVMDYLKGFPAPISFPYFLDLGKSIHKAYIQRDMPTVLIVGPDGKLLARSPSVGAEQLISYLEKLL